MPRLSRPAAVSILLLAIAAGGITLGRLQAQPAEADSKDKREVQQTEAMIADELPQWKFHGAGNEQTPFQLVENPVLRWTNPGIGRVYGNLYLWTHAGRPEVVMAFYKGYEPEYAFTGEMHSLSLDRLTAERDGRVVWQPTTAGVTFQNLPGAPEPAATPAARLVQMRNLAREFSAEVKDTRRNEAGEKQILRLLTRPLYRYSSPQAKVIDGALFALVLGTDPEVFLLIEARETATGPHWQFAPTRMNRDVLTLTHKDQTVWTADFVEFKDTDRKPYHIMTLIK